MSVCVFRGTHIAWIVAVLAGCSTTHSIRHVTPAEAAPGEVGYAVSQITQKTGLVTVTSTLTSAAAMSPPNVSTEPRDIVWRVGNNGNGLFLCRPTQSSEHDCQPVPLPAGFAFGPGSVIILDPKNLGRSLSTTTTYGGDTWVWGSVYTQAAQHRPLTPNYGVWVSAGISFMHCKIVKNQPVCLPALIPPLESGKPNFFTLVRPEMTTVVREGNELVDVMWLQHSPGTGVGGLVRCEARGADAPACANAKFQ